MSHRVQQVTSTLKKATQQVLTKGLADPRIRGMITITEVRVSKDLQHATVLVSVYPEKFETATLAGLQHATLRIQRAVNELMHMRRPPHLEFRVDHSLKKQAEILAAIRDAVGEQEPADDAANAEAPDEAIAPGGLREARAALAGDEAADREETPATRPAAALADSGTDTAAGPPDATDDDSPSDTPPVSGTADQLRALFDGSSDSAPSDQGSRAIDASDVNDDDGEGDADDDEASDGEGPSTPAR